MNPTSRFVILVPFAVLGCSRASNTTTAPDDALGAAEAAVATDTGAAVPVDTGVIAPVDAGVTAASDVVVVPGPDASVAINRTCNGTAEPAALADPGTCLVRFAEHLTRPRVMAFASNGDVFVSTSGKIQVLFDDDHDGVSSDGERADFVAMNGLGHGLALSPDGHWVYASTTTDVYRWSYAPGQRAATSEAQHVLAQIPASAHSARPLLFDASGRLLVMVGSDGNLDTSDVGVATRAQIRRFTLPDTLPTAGVSYATGEIVARGMRNETGLTMDSSGRMWGVENGRDQVHDSANNDIHLDNPGEEVNRIDGAGSTNFGYPSCWSEGLIQGGAGGGTQHADTEITQQRQSDAWCRSAANVRPPAFVLPAHWAPLGIVQYTGNVLPSDWRGRLFVTSHGSWNHEAPTGQVGRVIARLGVSADGRIESMDRVVAEANADGTMHEGSWSVRPVDIKNGPDGALYFTDDNGGRILRIGAR